MIVLQRHKGPFLQRESFFPNNEQMHTLIKGIRQNEILKIWHAPVPLKQLPEIVSETPNPTTVIDLKRSLDEILGRIHARTRTYIRSARQLGARLRIASDEQARIDLMALHERLVFAKDYGAQPGSWARFGFIRTLTDAFTAYLDGVPLCAHLIMRDDESGTATCGPAGSARTTGKSANLVGQINKYLHWKEIAHYKAAGFKIYDFDGIDPKAMPLSLVRFKLEFGGDFTTTYHYILAGPLAKAGIQVSERARTLLRRVGFEPQPRTF